MKALILDIQHFGKPDQSDMGASFDANKDGKISQFEQEAYFTSVLAGLITRVAYKKKINVIILNSGAYSARHADANKIALENMEDQFFYMAMHFNAGKKSPPFYGLIGYDARSTNGANLANELKIQWGAKAIVSDVRTLGVLPTSTEYMKNIHNTIAGIYNGPNNIRGVCLELAFLEDTKAFTITSLNAMATAIVDSVINWK